VESNFIDLSFDGHHDGDQNYPKTSSIDILVSSNE